ncbi:hypothetical protein DFH07DRAFT_1005850 [Mycena maculata]|uniref:Uncharacterized protein n=1 Tax=Mycena maculata TaxID=230809 RepID=A0AAD7JQD0_9AGAR|nr:hypothetical protein DFH07DRAFT_1005850 [Mycena maculata]
MSVFLRPKSPSLDPDWLVAKETFPSLVQWFNHNCLKADRSVMSFSNRYLAFVTSLQAALGLLVLIDWTTQSECPDGPSKGCFLQCVRAAKTLITQRGKAGLLSGVRACRPDAEHEVRGDRYGVDGAAPHGRWGQAEDFEAVFKHVHQAEFSPPRYLAAGVTFILLPNSSIAFLELLQAHRSQSDLQTVRTWTGRPMDGSLVWELWTDSECDSDL